MKQYIYMLHNMQYTIARHRAGRAALNFIYQCYTDVYNRAHANTNIFTL